MPAGVSPTQRAMKECRSRGWIPWVVEKWNPHAKIKQDMYGCIDVIAITPDEIIGLQITSGSNHASRRAKCLEEPRMKDWCAVAGLEVWSYAKQGARGEKKAWTLRTERLNDAFSHPPAPEEQPTPDCPR
jgi:hypothetical protein